MTGLVTGVAQHLKSDKLKVCQVDIGAAGGTIQVVTNSAAVREGIAVVLAVCFLPPGPISKSCTCMPQQIAVHAWHVFGAKYGLN